MYKNSIDERAVQLAQYIIESKDTVRGTAKKYGVSKSTVHNDLTERLPQVDTSLVQEVREVLKQNKNAAPSRGGAATKRKKEMLKSKK